MKPKVFIVHEFRAGNLATDFAPVGVFTKREDAEALRDELRPTSGGNLIPIVERTFDEFLDDECERRLGSLAKALEKLFGKTLTEIVKDAE